MSDVQLDWFGVTISGTPVYIDQEGVAWDRSCGRCPRCNTPTRYDRRIQGGTLAGFYVCGCGLKYDEPIWADVESAFITCISDDESKDDPDPGIRALYREYHDLPMEDGWTWPERPKQ